MIENSKIGGDETPSSCAITGPAASSAKILDVPLPPRGYGFAEVPIDYLILLRRYRSAIVLFFCLFGIAAVLYVLFAPRVYRANTVLEITGVNQDFLDSRTVTPEAAQYTAESYIDTQVRLLSNEAIWNRVVAVMAPKVPPSLVGGRSDGEDVIRTMLRNMRARSEGASNLVKISLTGPDAHLVASTTNELAKQYIQEEEDARLSRAVETGNFLAKQMGEARAKLQRSEDALQEYARISGIVLTSDTHEPIAAEHLREIQQGLAQAEVDRANRLAKAEIAQSAPIASVPQVVDDPTARQDIERLRDLRMQLANLGTTMTPANYRVERIQAQIQDLESEMRRHRDVIVRRLILEDREAERRQQLLEGAYHHQLSIVTDQGLKQVRYNMLRHDADVDRQLYQSIVQKVRDAGILAAMRATNARVVSPAIPPLFPSSPKLAVTLPLGFLFAAAVSLLYILGMERRNKGIRGPGDTQRHLGPPELGVIPKARTGAIQKRRPAVVTIGVSGATQKPAHPMLGHWRESAPSFVTEAYRSTTASILFSRSTEILPKVLVITSPQPQCGKTIVTANLAISLSEVGNAILVIEGDIRRPHLASLFGISAKEGLRTLLEDTGHADIRQYVQGTDFPGVYVLPSGTPSDRASAILQSKRLSSIIAAFRGAFDFILIDAPPVLGIVDARILCRSSDAAIIICRAGRTSSDDLDRTQKVLMDDGTNIIGTILNDYDVEREQPSYYRTYAQYKHSASSSPS